MAQDFKASFIPKKDISSTRGGGSKKTVGLLMMIAVIIFVLSLLLAGGVFAYKKILERNLSQKEDTLQRAKDAFDPDIIEELARMDKRIRASKELLDSHVVVSPIFELLEDNTVRNVRFEEFEFIIQENGEIRLTLAGQARSYGAIVLQSEAFGESRFLRDQIFRDFDLNQQGNVSFAFDSAIERELISFRENLNNL